MRHTITFPKSYSFSIINHIPKYKCIYLYIFLNVFQYLFHQYLLMTRLWILYRFSAFWGICEIPNLSDFQLFMPDHCPQLIWCIAPSKLFLCCFRFHLVSAQYWTHDSIYAISCSPFRTSLHICSPWYAGCEYSLETLAWLIPPVPIASY